jgi:hypothetical protein
MGDFKPPINENGFMKDIFQTTKNNYLEVNEPIIFNNRRSYSLKGIIQETPMSNLFFSDININVIQMTIRYHIFQDKNKRIGYQSENELFTVMRSIYLQYANSVLTSDKMLSNLRTLNKAVVDYCIGNIGDQLDQYDAYLEKISSASVPMDRPQVSNTDSWTYDMSNIIF